MYGRQLLSNSTVLPTRVSADGSPIQKAGGITIDWTTVTAPGSDTTLADGSIILTGRKFLRYGQVMTKITASGKFGPYDSAAGDGRQTLARGDCFLVDETVLQYGGTGATTGATVDHLGVIEGGELWFDRILNAGTGTASLAAGPQLAALLAVLPRASLVKN